MTKALVTGGAGYFGDLLVRHLQQRGYDLRIFDLRTPEVQLPGVECMQGDIRNPDAIASACQGMDVVFHNVAQVPLAKDRHLFWSVNCDGTRTLLDACLLQKVQKVVYTSSSAVYGVPKCNPVTESTLPDPQEDYGRAKLAGEMLCREFALRGLDVSIVRPRTIIGHGRLGIFQVLFEWIYQGRNIPVLDDGRNVYQFVHADDLAEACHRIANHRGAQSFNCGAKRFGSMRQALESLCGYAGTGSLVRSLPGWLFVPAMEACSKLGLSPLGAYHSLMYGRSMFFDITKSENELHWTPKYSNDEMFIESYRWYIQNRDIVLARSGESHHRSALNQGALKLLQKLL